MGRAGDRPVLSTLKFRIKAINIFQSEQIQHLMKIQVILMRLVINTLLMIILGNNAWLPVVASLFILVL